MNTEEKTDINIYVDQWE